MAGVNKSDIPVIAAFMPDFWKAIKQFWIVEDNNSYWKELTEAMNDLYKKYPTEFCKRQILAFEGYLVDRCEHTSDRD